ncbi:hypothetical protein CA284_19935 [Enterobacter mori]|nr:hypothetical protein CA284_19935 [Enterobacter mori]
MRLRIRAYVKIKCVTCVSDFGIKLILLGNTTIIDVRIVTRLAYIPVFTSMFLYRENIPKRIY